jgi:DNA-binding transcriptional LysR family regulator
MLKDFFTGYQLTTVELVTFITVAEMGSFSKAADALYVSPTAVMKQMNRLEQVLSTKLLVRSTHGITLTPAGETMYKSSQNVLEMLQDSITEIKRNAQNDHYSITVGNSMFEDARYLIRALEQSKKFASTFSVEIVPFSSDGTTRSSVYKSIGRNLDIIVGHYEEGWLTRDFNALKIRDDAVCAAVPYGHPLSAKERLKPTDFKNQKIIILDEGASTTCDSIRKLLLGMNQNTSFQDAGFYFSFDDFNRCAYTDSIILGSMAWRDIHPSFKFIPVDWDFTWAYGIIYSRKPSQAVGTFVDAVKRYLQENTDADSPDPHVDRQRQ